MDTRTLFRFHQDGDTVHAEYAGGGVRTGHLLGVFAEGRLRHGYVRVTTDGRIEAGHGQMTVDQGAYALRLMDRWEWEDGRGAGLCIMEESGAVPAREPSP